MAESEELYYLSIDEASQLLRKGELSPVELIQAYLDRIQDKDATLHAYITVLHDEALSAARKAEGEMRAGSYRGSLHGIPIALKDLVDTRGVLTTGGSAALKDRVPTEGRHCSIEAARSWCYSAW